MILVLCPLPLEAELLRQGDLDPEIFRIECGGHGKVEFALKTYKWILQVRPKLVVCAGTAGALLPSVQPLDVVVAEQTVEHDFKLKCLKRPQPSFDGDSGSLLALRESKFNFPVHFGAIASGDEDVVDGLRGKEIAAATGALAVAWEGAGGARAAQFCKVPFIEIRGITDQADQATVETFNKNLPIAMQRVRQVLGTPLLF